MEQMETAEQAKAARGPKATIRRQLTRVHTPATATGDWLMLDKIPVMYYLHDACIECGLYKIPL